MKKLIILILSVSIIKIYAVEDKFSIAVDYYNNKNYTEALIIFDSLINKGYKKSEMYYNIGNCHYKLNNWSNAILFYEKCLAEAPFHSDAIYNLNLTKNELVDKFDRIPTNLFSNFYNYLNQLLSSRLWFLFLIYFCWITIFISFIKRIIFKKNDHKFIYLFLSINLSLYMLSYLFINFNSVNKKAIIMKNVVSVKSSPAKGSKELFLIHSGAKIEITDEVTLNVNEKNIKWIEILIENGEIGWIEIKNIEII